MNQPKAIILPGVYDALTAILAERAGFRMIAHTGYGVAATLLGQPDVGLVCFKEMCDRVQYIARAVNIPVLADADTGYGNPINVFRTIKEFIKAGAAGLFIEDQVWPKRCGHLSGKQIISVDEMVSKIKAAVDARDKEDPNFVVGARTDAIATDGFNEAIRRAKAYRDAGADFIFIEAYENLEQMKSAIKEIKAPLLVNLIEGGKTPVINAKDAEDLGFKLIAFPLTSLWATTNAVNQIFKILKETGSAKQYLDKLIKWAEFNEIIGLPKIKEMEEKYK
ncbi:MAG: carboxyvinyl-carboxyphosphonate phosphorylmutase [Deltaproteobacteria bacterium]|nr:MAG: carboxyvinyl-carboxyphosphonate phosphorylmutase [Deltaproteobacteria bacterium]